MHLPDFETFLTLAERYQLVPVYRCLVSDALTPVTAFRQLDRGGSACLFESVVGGEKVGRYSFLTAEPFLEISARGTTVTVRAAEAETVYESSDPLEELRKHVLAHRAAHLPGLPPFTGGAVGYAGYDVVRYVEKLPNPPPDDRSLPDLCFAFYDQMVVFDHINKTLLVIALARTDEGQANAAAAYAAGLPASRRAGFPTGVATPRSATDGYRHGR